MLKDLLHEALGLPNEPEEEKKSRKCHDALDSAVHNLPADPTVRMRYTQLAETSFECLQASAEGWISYKGLPVECTTPLGLPVEPEVYRRNRGCSESTHSTGQCLSCLGTTSWYQISLPSVHAHLALGTALCSYTSTFCTCTSQTQIVRWLMLAL